MLRRYLVDPFPAIPASFVGMFAKYKQLHATEVQLGVMHLERDGPFFVAALQCSNDSERKTIRSFIAPVAERKTPSCMWKCPTANP